MKRACKRIFTAVAAVFLALLVPVAALAEGPKDTFLTIMVRNAPKDLTVTLRYPESAELEDGEMIREDRAWETYFRVYFVKRLIKWRRGLPKGTYLQLSTGGETFTMTFPEGESTAENAIFILDVKNRTMTSRLPPLRTALLIAMRVSVVLALQVLIFYLFGFRSRRSWRIFLITILVTQFLLGWLVMGGASTLSSDYVLWALVALLLSISFVTVMQTILLSHFLWEFREKRAVSCAVLCNLATLVVSSIQILFLPM